MYVKEESGRRLLSAVCCLLQEVVGFGGGRASGMAAGSLPPTPEHQMMIIGNPMVLHFLPSDFKCNEILGLDAEGKVAV